MPRSTTSRSAPTREPSFERVERAETLDARIRDELRQVVEEGRWRAPRTFDAYGPVGALHDATRALDDPAWAPRPVVSFASNDYLGLSAHRTVAAAAHDALDRWGTGSGASRLVTGSRPVHDELEQALAAWKGTEAAVTFPTGFAANLGVLGALGGPGVRVLSDELNHASIIDGCRLSRSHVAVYRHCDLGHLGELLRAPSGTPTIVVTDSVFSMDGDAAPLDELVALCADHDALLVLDEAHAVLGPHLPRPQAAPIVRVGTLSKTLGSLGGFVAASRDVIELLVNRARSYIFSTAPTPADAAAALASLRLLRSAEGEALVARLAALVELMAEAGLVPPGHLSPIIPVVLGSEQAALDASASLLAQGLWVPAIRPPTVPVGTSRLRVTLSAAHSDDDVARLLDALVALPSPLSLHCTVAGDPLSRRR